MNNEIHNFERFSVSRTAGGDYVAELDNGDEIMLLSPSGSEEHQHAIRWIEGDRTQAEFEAEYPELA